jgi:hypothetical protein
MTQPQNWISIKAPLFRPFTPQLFQPGKRVALFLVDTAENSDLSTSCNIAILFVTTFEVLQVSRKATA